MKPDKKLGKTITIVNVAVFIVIILVGGVSIFLTQGILHNAYKIEEISEHIAIIGSIHADAYRLVLAIHHFLIDPDEIYSKEAITEISKIKAKVEKYRAMELAEKYEERIREIKILDTILEDIQGLEDVTSFFENFSETGVFDKDELIGLEEFAYELESSAAEMNKIHFAKISAWEKESQSNMWNILILYAVFLTFGVISVYMGHNLISKKVVNPIKELASTAKEISQGTFDRKVHTDSKTEIGMLYQSFNKMSETLLERENEIKKYTTRLEDMVHERTKALQESHTQLIQAEKLASIGEMSGYIAHELNNPIGIIVSRIDCILMDSKEKGYSDYLIKDIEVIKKHSQRIAKFTKGFLSFSRKSPIEFSLTDINAVIDETLLLIESQFLNYNIHFHKHMDRSIPKIYGNANQLQQVFFNIFNNAKDAIPDGGKIEITSNYNNDRMINIKISDTGAGIPKENLNKIFNPFFTTKERDKGTGLGLSVSYGIIKEHEGQIKVHSQTGVGTSFEILLPVKENTSAGA